MKKIYNDKITKISKYDDFVEMKNDLFSMYNDFVTMCICDNISNINFETMCQLNEYYNDFIKYIDKINDISFYNQFYLFDDNDTTFIIFVDEYDVLHTFNLFNNNFSIGVVFNNIEYGKTDDLLNAIIDKLNEQITINEQNYLICEN